MQRKDYSCAKLPKLPPVDSREDKDKSITNNLYRYTGLRMFHPKFMEELRHKPPQIKSGQFSVTASENMMPVVVGKPVVTTDNFTGKDRTNETKASDQNRGTDSRVKESKRIEQLEKPKLERVRPKCGRPKGLINLGNTCYMNAILQSLFSLEEFNLALEKEISKKPDKPIVNSYIRLLQCIRQAGDRDTVSPSDFKLELGRKKTRFSNNQQQDAQEMLTAFLESANEEMCRVKEKPKYQELKGDLSKESVKKIADNWWSYFKMRDDSVICDFFQGQTLSIITCHSCGSRSASCDNFWGLPLSLGRRNSNLNDLLSASLATESQLGDYCCGECKQAKKFTKMSRLFRLPEVLVIQLKRFVFGWSRKEKIKDKIDVPLQINLKSVLSDDSSETNTIYTLKSTVQHSGQMNYGHYNGHVYSEKDDRWFFANDEQITREEVQLDSSKLYLLVYQKK